MKKSITKNYIYNLIYQITAIIVPLITTPYVSRVLGAEAIGVYSYTLSITTYFILFGTLGIALYGQREIAYLQENKKERSKVFWEILILRGITLTISIIFFYISFGIYNEYKIYYRILLLELCTYFIDISWFFQGIEEFKKTVLKNIMIRIISLMSVFIFVKSSNDLIKYFFIYVLSNFVGNLSLWAYVSKYVEKVKVGELNIKKHIRPTFELFIPQIAVQLSNVLDRTMLGYIINDKSEVGYYEQTQKYIKVLLTIESSLITVMIPRVANSFIKGEKEKLNKYISKSIKFIIFLALPMIFGTIGIIKQFVPIFYGNGYEKVGNIILIICPILLFVGLSNVLGTQYLLPTKQQKKYTISVVIGAVINFLLNTVMIRRFGAYGAALTTCFAEFTVLIIEAYMIRKEFNLIYEMKKIYKYLLSALTMFCAIKCIDIFDINIFCNIILKVILGIIVYLGMLYGIFKDDFVLEVIGKIREKIKEMFLKKEEKNGKAI